MLGLDGSFLRDYGVTMPIRGIAAISGPYDFYPFEYDEVRRAFGNAPNPEGTQPVNLVAPDAPPMLLMSGTTDPIVRVQNTEHLAEKLKAQNDWVTVKYYEGFGHLEPVIAMGALWRWRIPVLADITAFFTQFGAFPSGAPRPDYVPEPPEGQSNMDEIVAKLDSMFSPIGGGWWGKLD
jgi:acetyl esterase/lipase